MASLLLVAVAPVLLIGAIAAAVANHGTVLRRDQRVSRGRTFALLKFQTLRAATPGDPTLVERDPANLSWAGRLLKRWYLDELPQLFNVLRGDISFVGPRPWPPAMVEEQVRDGLDYRLQVRAGLTGLAQITKGVEGTDYARRDLEYVDKSRALGSWALVRYDLRILAETVRVIARGQGLEF